MNVLIVDDQRLSRAGIVKMIAWEALGLRLAGECANGYEALRMLDELEIDLVITDVRMPLLDGLGLIEQAKELYPNIAFLVISGYDDYAYVRKSIQLAVADYLLKPADADELNAQLGLLIGKTRSAREKAETQLRKTREQFIHLLLEGAYDRNELLLEDWTDIRPEEGEDAFAAAMFDCSEDKALLEARFRTLADGCETFLIRMRGDCYTLVAMGRAEAIEALLPVLRAELEDRGSYRFAGIGAAVRGIEALAGTAKEASDAYLLQASLPDGGQERLTSPASEGASSEMGAFPLNSSWERDWLLLLKKGNAKAIVGKLDELSGAGEPSAGGQDWLEGVYPYLQLRGAREMYEAGLIDEQTYEEAFVIARKLPYIAGLERKRDVVADYFSRCLDSENRLQTKQLKEAVENAKAFIDANYRLPINLTDLALTSYMSPGYFSTLFRQHTGRNFLEYVTQLRIEHAKKLIADDPDAKIGDVAVQCGYQDLKHFRKLFKRYTGVTPLQYKEGTGVD
ncbi:helix-turn-helix domain-containing protein [Cohnella phaseoli]|uniref:Helix-turn-helix protein n=1 Tax=Cohnella phaseoli TaxID=456490 RepID=A0A3D9KPL2_9BACL|nr:helix-turn-helix domain-containing protein [Cohnella phaseoli]RED87867.1 helix-turn-helix protein [Cohnella phaseoli]